MGSSLVQFQSVGGHGCNRDAKVGEEVKGCGRFGCPDCEARRAIETLLRSGCGTFEGARFVHWPGSPEEVVDEYSLVPAYDGAAPGVPLRLKVTRKRQDFQRSAEVAVAESYGSSKRIG
jgi:hypothetical protein